MENALLCPNQARENGTVVDDIPPELNNNEEGSFSVSLGGISLPLKRYGPTAYLDLRCPTNDELDQLYDEIIDVTCEDGWDPYKDQNRDDDVTMIARVMQEQYLDDWLLNHHVRNIGMLQVSKPNVDAEPVLHTVV